MTIGLYSTSNTIIIHVNNMFSFSYHINYSWPHFAGLINFSSASKQRSIVTNTKLSDFDGKTFLPVLQYLL